MINMRSMSCIKGFTILEVMIALVILSIALVPMSGMFTSAQVGLRRGSEATEALSRAQGVMEEYKAKQLSGRDLTSVSRTDFADDLTSAYAVEVTPEPLYSNLDRVKVTVYYHVNDQERSLSLVTLMGSD